MAGYAEVDDGVRNWTDTEHLFVVGTKQSMTGSQASWILWRIAGGFGRTALAHKVEQGFDVVAGSGGIGRELLDDRAEFPGAEVAVAFKRRLVEKLVDGRLMGKFRVGVA
jgi:hypothetical protein